MDDAHRLWHQTLRAYDDADAFRANLNSAIQAFRSVTLMLQKEKRKVPGFDGWYGDWRDRMRADPVMAWLDAARTRIFHRGDLETYSSAIFRIRDEWGPAKPIAEEEVSPFRTTDDIAADVGASFSEHYKMQFGHGVPEHLLLVVERRWVDRDLPDWELLDALAHAYGVISTVAQEAHGRCGARYETRTRVAGEVEQFDVSHLGGRLPCMVATAEARTTTLKLGTGEAIRVEKRLMGHDVADLEFGEAATKRYRLYDLVPPATDDPMEWGSFYMQLARRLLLVDKHHVPMTFLLGPNGREQIVHPFADRAEKFATWDLIANQVQQSGATAIIAIAEAWLYLLPEGPSESPPIQPEARREGLQVLVATQDGRYRNFVMPFSKRLGRIIPEPISVQDLAEPPNFIKAVVEAWKKW